MILKNYNCHKHYNGKIYFGHITQNAYSDDKFSFKLFITSTALKWFLSKWGPSYVFHITNWNRNMQSTI